MDSSASPRRLQLHQNYEKRLLSRRFIHTEQLPSPLEQLFALPECCPRTPRARRNDRWLCGSVRARSAASIPAIRSARLRIPNICSFSSSNSVNSGFDEPFHR